jgi:hypothetical protein
MAFIHDFNETNKCFLMSQQVCIREKIYQNIDNVLQSCSECPLECESRRLLLSTYFSEFPTPKYADELIRTSFLNKIFKSFELNSTEIQSSLLAFNVYYEDIKEYEVNILSKISEKDLLCEIGNNLGLFIGATILSVIELFEIILSTIYVVCKKLV